MHSYKTTEKVSRERQDLLRGGRVWHRRGAPQAGDEKDFGQDFGAARALRWRLHTPGKSFPGRALPEFRILIWTCLIGAGRISGASSPGSLAGSARRGPTCGWASAGPSGPGSPPWTRRPSCSSTWTAARWAPPGLLRTSAPGAAGGRRAGLGATPRQPATIRQLKDASSGPLRILGPTFPPFLFPLLPRCTSWLPSLPQPIKKRNGSSHSRLQPFLMCLKPHR